MNTYPTVPPAMPMPESSRADFEKLLVAHRGIVRKIAASYCRHADDCADLMQEIVLELWRAFPSFRPQQTFSTWMYRVALNVAISQQRRDRVRTGHESLDDRHAALVGASDVDVEFREQLALVGRAMASLGAIDRALLLLQLEGCSHHETGDVLGISPGNVATRLNRIRQQLRRTAAAVLITHEEEQGNDHGNR
jgi:RNA polymerase sigma-70 factor, ECF subfamily